MNREQQSSNGFVCETCGQGFDSLQELDEHQWMTGPCQNTKSAIDRTLEDHLTGLGTNG